RRLHQRVVARRRQGREPRPRLRRPLRDRRRDAALALAGCAAARVAARDRHHRRQRGGRAARGSRVRGPRAELSSGAGLPERAKRAQGRRPRGGMSRDPFGTAWLRSAVLEAWRRSPARLREDANTEEDHARGYYRDRVVVELAQNAADAATRSGGRGRLLLRVTRVAGRDVLLAANTGAPLDAAGVAALASMRASSKRDEAGLVGRFGVGFAAVRSVADEAVVLSSAGAVRFSVARTRALLAEEPGLADELSRRGDALPALRLPFDADDGGLPGTAPEADDGAHPEPDPVPDPALDGPRSADTGPAVRALLDLASSLVEHDGAGRAAWSTVVGLVLRDAEAAASVRAQLAALGDPLLLALPGLGELVVETPEGSFAVADVEERWHVARASGTAAPELLADRPTEERAASGWQVAWALPRSGTQREGVVFAPTPTLE